jgi:cobalt-zinc-cadmium efflux system protein
MKQHTHNTAFTEHLFEYRAVERKKLILSLTITLVVMVVEIVGGILAHSIALISDAGHMFTHSFAIGLSLVAIVIARQPPCHHRTFGLYRAEILAAFINGLFLLVVVCVIAYEAVMRILHPTDILSISMFIIGFVGLSVNVASILILHGSHREDLNVRSVFYHMVADAVSSIAIVIGAVVIHLTGWNIVDPLLSLAISAVIFVWAWGILKEAGKVLLEMAPTGLTSETLIEDIKKTFPEVEELYNTHLWTITSNMLVFTTHILFRDTQTASDNKISITRMTQYLVKKYNVIESTIQVVAPGEEPVCAVPEQ